MKMHEHDKKILSLQFESVAKIANYITAPGLPPY